MNNKKLSGLLISDFNLDNFAAYLRKDGQDPQVEIVQAPFGQVSQTLLGGTLSCWSPGLDFVVIWTRPEAVLEQFRGRLNCLETKGDEITAEVDDYASAILETTTRARMVFVPIWTVSPLHQGSGLVDLRRGAGVARALMEMNLRLLDKLDNAGNVYPLNAGKWIEMAGERAYNPRLWYTGKIPFGNEVFKAAATDIKSALRGLEGKARKLVIVDLDDTLWGGVVGERGWQYLILGGHDPDGEALVDFQRELKSLTRRGVVLAIVSKNEEAAALEAIEKHPEMVLQAEDFAAWRINWQDKAQNILDLAAELNLGLESAVFIDDNPAERDRVRESLPEVLVPDWPADKRFYPQALLSLGCFDQPALSKEDQRRSQMYAEERQRTVLKKAVGTLDEWLQTLGLTVHVEALQESNLARATQLLNKTNQMNLATRRLTEHEFISWCREAGRQVWTFRTSDKFGDSGLVGIASAEADGRRALLRDFVLSCRVMGRRVEETMLNVAVGWARRQGLEELRAVCLPTERNKPCNDFFERSGLRRTGENEFIWDTTTEYPLHPAVRLVG